MSLEHFVMDTPAGLLLVIAILVLLFIDCCGNAWRSGTIRAERAEKEKSE